jgi:hypothetical protein
LLVLRRDPTHAVTNSFDAFDPFLGRSAGCTVRPAGRRCGAGRRTHEGFMKISRDWWAVVIAAAAMLLVKSGLIAHIPW